MHAHSGLGSQYQSSGHNQVRTYKQTLRRHYTRCIVGQGGGDATYDIDVLCQRCLLLNESVQPS